MKQLSASLRSDAVDKRRRCSSFTTKMKTRPRVRLPAILAVQVSIVEVLKTLGASASPAHKAMAKAIVDHQHSAVTQSREEMSSWPSPWTREGSGPELGTLAFWCVCFSLHSCRHSHHHSSQSL